MRQPKYSIGDRLKVVGNPQDDWAGSDWNTGDYMTVVHMDIGPDYVVYWDWIGDATAGWPEGVKCGLMEHEVELADIADSPLYKALR